MNDFALQSLTLCKYNLCSLHFSMCHISWDPNKWKMDQKVMKNRHGWITCTKVSAPSKTFPQIVLAFRETPFPFFCSGKNISLATTGFPTMGEPGGPPPPRPNSLGAPPLAPLLRMGLAAEFAKHLTQLGRHPSTKTLEGRSEGSCRSSHRKSQ